MKFTAARIESLQPRKSEYVEWDDALPGFGCRVHPTGRKVFMIRYRNANQVQRKMNIGNASVFPVDVARQQARALLVRVSQGEDPAQDRQNKRNSMTVAGLRDQHLEYSRAHSKPSTVYVYGSYWKSIVEFLGENRKIADIAESNVIALHTSLGATGKKVRANRCLEVFRNAMNFAERMGWAEKHSNPCIYVKPFKEIGRNRILRPEELQRLVVAVEEYGKNTKCWSASYAIRLLMITGLRRSEWCRSRWEWIDWQASTMYLPDAKAGPRTVHLSNAAIDILREIRGRSTSDWIIPTWDGTRPLDGLGHHWRIIRAAAGIPDVHIHDLRHTVGSLGHRAGLTQAEVADMLGHRHMKTAARYIHTYDDEKRAKADLVAAVIMGK